MPRIIKPAPGTFTAATVTVDSSGRVIAASSGAAGEKNMLPAYADVATPSGANGTYTANSSATQIFVYLRGAGGGGGGSAAAPGRVGGYGGFGIWSVPVSAPYSVPYALGSGGTAGGGNNTNVAGNPGGAGNASSWNTNTAIANGGGGGEYNGDPSGGTGTAGTAPGSQQDLTNPSSTPSSSAFIYEQVPPLITFATGFVPNTDTNYIARTKTAGRGGTGGVTPSGNVRNGNVGMGGAVFVYENLGQ